jgi:hypothetical protein
VEPADDQPFHLGKSIKEYLNKRPPKPVGIVQLLNVVEIVQIIQCGDQVELTGCFFPISMGFRV